MAAILLFQEVIEQQSEQNELGTATATKSREDRDQDYANSLAFGTQTLTESRENRDQDKSNEGYSLLPRRWS